MLLLGAILLAVLVLPAPWSYVAVISAAVLEVGEAWFFLWWTRRGHPAVGAEALVGRTAEVVEPLRPRGRVRLDGELWAAVCAEGAELAEDVAVERVDGLTLVVRRC